MRDDRTDAEYASALARRYLSLLAADLFAEADALRRALPFHTWPEPWRSASYTRFLIDVGEPGEALAEARACAAACGWDEWSSLQLVWVQLVCDLDKEALETLNEVEVSPSYAAQADDLRFRLHVCAGDFECAAAFLSDRGLGLGRHELESRRRIWMYLASPEQPGEPLESLFELDRPHPPLPNGLVIPNDLDASLDPGVTALEFAVRTFMKMLSKDYRAAEAEAVVLTRIAPRFPLGWWVLGKVRACLGKHDSAGDAFDEALRLCPSYAKARQARASVRYREARFREAAQDAELVVMQRPLSTRAAGLLFRSYIRSLQLRKAWKAFLSFRHAFRHALRVCELKRSYRSLQQAESRDSAQRLGL